MRVRIPVWLLAVALSLTVVAILFDRNSSNAIRAIARPGSGLTGHYLYLKTANQWACITGTTIIMAIVAWLLLAGVVVSRLIQDRKSAHTQVSLAAQEADPKG